MPCSHIFTNIFIINFKWHVVTNLLLVGEKLILMMGSNKISNLVLRIYCENSVYVTQVQRVYIYIGFLYGSKILLLMKGNFI